LYFALTGQPPFAGGTAQEKIRRHRGEEPVPVSQRNPAVPEPFAALVQRMMAKDPDRRFASAAALRQELLAWASGEPALPLDRQSDPSFQLAVATLEAAESAPEMANTVVIVEAEETPHPSGVPVQQALPAPPEDSGLREYLWIGVGLLGFWLALLVILGMILLLR